MTCVRFDVVCLDLNGNGGCSRCWAPNHIVVVDVLLDEGVGTILPLGIEHDVLLLVKVHMFVLRESKGASAKES